ncbi:hypothetical protein KP509_24G063900 [Ceratopteris richardii]|uniref:Uncharacterized protein n=1 Tax=Ceratopteris richardii TaxID=49495 RepID=A0A8T2RYH4_CERRI|nr:hypothetical protein KP509_24G063900 [Ceratopteris richardii]
MMFFVHSSGKPSPIVRLKTCAINGAIVGAVYMRCSLCSPVWSVERPCCSRSMALWIIFAVTKEEGVGRGPGGGMGGCPGRIRWHNVSNLQPDVIYSLHSVIQPPSFLGDTRYLDGGRLAEQQALLLRYQQENLQYLHEEVLRLQESLSKYERSQDGAPQVDLVHILAAREQEVRAMTAERDQLQSELRLARDLIAERESSVAQIQAINDRFVEENERLRSMLAEWSSRTAKLELALEAEQVSNAELNRRLALLQHVPEESMG